MSASRICSSSGANGVTVPPTSSRVLRCRIELDRLDARLALARPREIAAPHVAEPSRDRVRRLHVDDEQVLLEPGRPCDHLAGFVEDDRVPVEDELVLAADEVAEGEVGARVTRPGDEHLLALLGLADVVRRRREVHDELAPASARSVAGGPGCQTSSQIVIPTETPPMRSTTRSRPSAK